MKQCPFCKKELEDTAIRCRYCRRPLPGKEATKKPFFESKQENKDTGQYKKEIVKTEGVMTDKVKYHIRNKNICISLFILLILLQAALGFYMAAADHQAGKIIDKVRMHHMHLGVNLIWGLFFSILFTWYMLTLEFTKKWWIFPTSLIVWFFSIYFNLLPWIILIVLLSIRRRTLVK